MEIMPVHVHLFISFDPDSIFISLSNSLKVEVVEYLEKNIISLKVGYLRFGLEVTSVAQLDIYQKKL